MQPSPKLLVAYLDGWDRRLIDEERAPFVNGLFETCPWAMTTGPASVDLLPTILTGTRPDQHGMFGVRLREPEPRGLVRGLIDLLPDPITTTVQCGLYGVTGLFDLPAIPPRRRRRFELHRSKIPRKKHGLSELLEIGGMPTCLGVLGEDQSRYVYSTTSDPTADHLDDLASGRQQLEFVQLYTMDLVFRWNYGDEAMVREYSRRMDDFVRRLLERCRQSGVTLVLLSDHGYDATQGSVNVRQALRRLGLGRDEYTEFVEITSSRFWFHSDRARDRIPAALGRLEHVTVHQPAEFMDWGVNLSDPAFGELFCLTQPGWVLFPNDFHNPLGNVILGLTDRMQRRRLVSPKHRGNHALRPGHPAAAGFVLVADDRYRANRQNAKLEDVAPTLLAMLGRDPPGSMPGAPIFET